MQQLKVLVRTPNWIGDHVMASGFYRGLRAFYPSAHITHLCPAVLRGFPDGKDVCDEKIVLSQTSPRLLQERRFDLAVGLPASIRSACDLFRARIPHRVAFAEFGAELFLTSHLRWKGRDSGKHKSELYLELLEFLTASSVKGESPSKKPAMERHENILVVAPGASIPLREWPYFRELFERLSVEAPNVSVIVIGNDQRWEILSGKNVKNLVGKTSLTDVVRLCRSARVVLANDSGIAHVAATVANTPTLVLFGPGDPAYVLPRGPAQVIRREIPCSPCEKPYCVAPYGYQRCLKDISVEEVWGRVRPLLSL